MCLAAKLSQNKIVPFVGASQSSFSNDRTHNISLTVLAKALYSTSAEEWEKAIVS